MPNESPPEGEPTSDRRGRRLESWKEIAAYLGREVTTAQRWEKRQGLPVRRLPHDRGGSVSAYTAELDAWREARERASPPSPPESESPEAVPGGSASTVGAPAARRESLEPRPPIQRSLRLLWLAAAVGILAILTTVWTRPLPAPAPLDSLAVLPFANATGDAELDYVGDGLAEALTNRLSVIEGLRVIPRTTTFRFRGRDGETDVRELGSQLGVKAVVTGRVARHGDALLVQVDLTDARSNAQIWGARYQRPTADLLTIQQDIAQAIVSEMQLRLGREERARFVRAATEDGEAYLLYLKGVHHWYKMTPTGYERALESFSAAVSRDPGFALAHAWLGGTHYQRGRRLAGVGPSPREAMPLAVASLEQALALDNGLAEAYVMRGMLRLTYDWDVASAERDIRRALELNSRFPLAHSALSHWLYTQRRFDEAVAATRRWLELDPLSLMANTELGALYVLTGQFQEAFEQLGRTLELDDYPRARFILVLALSAAGRFDEAVEAWIEARRRSGNEEGAQVLRQAFAAGGYRAVHLAERDRLLRRSLTSYVPPMLIAYAAAGGGDADTALQYLERAYQERQDDLSTIHVNIRVANLRTDPRFLDLVRRVGVDPLARR
jgi:TolB-like protein/Flp pilus assembly protein TadD